MSEKQNEAVENVLSETVSKKAAQELACLDGDELTTVYHLLQEQMECNGLMEEEPTVSGLLQVLYDLTQAQFTERITVEEYQEILSQQVSLLADILGIELKE